jgi:hypothetical protein
VKRVLSLKVVKTIEVDESSFVAAAARVFESIGVAVELTSVRRIRGPTSPAVDFSGTSLTEDQRVLFGLPLGATPAARDHALVCFVGELPQQSLGFSSVAFASCLVSRSCGTYTLAHELGHLLGLSHVPDPDNLMYEFGPADETSPALDSAQQAQALSSRLLGPNTSADERRMLVEQAAYFRWLDRGGDHGLDVDDWLAAEAEQHVADRVG